MEVDDGKTRQTTSYSRATRSAAPSAKHHALRELRDEKKTQAGMTQVFV